MFQPGTHRPDSTFNAKPLWSLISRSSKVRCETELQFTILGLTKKSLDCRTKSATAGVRDEGTRSKHMQEMEGQTLFIVGEGQVGKTTIARRLFGNLELISMSSDGRATKYRAFLQVRKFPIKILEIRNSAFLAENEIDFHDERDIVVFCYAIDDPDSFQRVDDAWIPLFSEHLCDSMHCFLMGNKTDLRDNAEVVHNLAERGLRPVSRNQGIEIFDRHGIINVFAEWGD